MTKKVLILLLALSMACSTMFAAFAMDEGSANESSEQSSGVNTKEQSEPANTDETELNNEEEETEVTTEVSKTPSLQSDPQVGKYPGEVTLVGQWCDESNKQEDTIERYTSSEDPIGKPIENDGLLRKLAKTFLGWSDMPSINNGHLQEGARYFSPEDKIGTAFPNGIPKNAKLYGVYFSLIDENERLAKGPEGIAQIKAALNKFRDNFSDSINSNSLVINKTISAEATMPDTNLKSETKSGKDNQDRTILDYYKKDADNEVVLSSEFSMDPVIALVTYRNPVGSNQLRPILSRDYIDRRADNGNFDVAKGKEAGYTHVDLNVELDENFKIPEKLYLEFFGYSWRPLYVMDANANNNKLQIYDPTNDTLIGDDKNSFNSLVNKVDQDGQKILNPKVQFGVNTKNLVSTDGKYRITVRVILRDYNVSDLYDEKISESNVTPDENKTILETILNNMTLRSLTKKDLSGIRKNLTNDQLNDMVIRISDDEASKLAKTNGKETLPVNGNVNGHMFVSAGTISKKVPFLGNIEIPLKSDTEINKVDSNELRLGYVIKEETPAPILYKVTHEFVAAEGINIPLPKAIVDRTPADQLYIANGTKVYPSDFDRSDYYDEENDGVWSFVSWDKESDTIRSKDVHFIGTWTFTKSKKPTPETPQEPKETVPKVSNEQNIITPKVPKTPQTADNQSIALALSLTIVSLASIAMLQRKRKNVK